MAVFFALSGTDAVWCADAGVSAAGDPPSVLWAGSVQANIRSGKKLVHQRDDGSILIAGHGNLERVQGVGLVAVSGDGEPLWQRIYGTGRALNQPLGLGSIPGGSIALTGYLYDPGVRGGRVPWYARLAADGTIESDRRYDGYGLYLPAATAPVPDGGALMTGRVDRNSVWLMRLGPDGEIVWNRTYTRSGVGLRTTHVEETGDQGIVLVGTMDRDAWVARLRPDGDPVWSVRAGTEAGYERAVGATTTADGGTLVAASSTSLGADVVLWLLQFDAQGNVLWQSALGGSGVDNPRTVASDGQGGIWIAGVHRDAGIEEGDGVPWIVHVDGDGTIVADVRIHEPSIIRRFDDEEAGIAPTRGGGAVFVARSADIETAIAVFELDRNGRGPDGCPDVKPAESHYRRVELPVRPAAVESGRLEVESTEVESVSLTIPFDNRRQWIVAAKSQTGHRLPVEPMSLPDEVEVRVDRSSDTAAEWLIDKKFDDLDRRIGELIASRERDPWGWMLVLNFYAALDIERSPLQDHGQIESTEMLEVWHRERPGSVAARAALAEAYISLAWDYRGSGFGREVTPEGAAGKEQYLAQAWELLEEVWTDRPVDPGYWSVFLKASHLWRRTPPFPAEVLESALEIAPDYLPIYLNQAHYLAPQWGGAPGEIQRFAAAATDSASNPFGEELYARIAVSLARGSEKNKLFGEHGFDWPRVRRGLELINRRYPERLNYHWAAFMAVLAGDRQAAKSFFEADGGGYGDDVRKIWKTETVYRQRVAWANRPVGGSWATADVDDWPTLALVVEPGGDSSPSAGSRMGFLVSRGDDRAPVLVTAVERSVPQPGNEEAVLELLGRGDRIASWVVVPKADDVEPVSGIRELEVGKNNDRIFPRSAILAEVPVDPGTLGVPVLGTADLDPSVRGYLIAGCAAGNPGCVQRMVRGRLASHGSSGLFTVTVDEAGFEIIRLGAPVVDTLGNVVGVVYERFFDGSAPDGPQAYQLYCTLLYPWIPRIDDERRPTLDLSMVGGGTAVENTAIELIRDRRWGDLVRLAGWCARQRATDGSWLGESVVRAFQSQTIDPAARPGRDAFDAVGAALAEWVAEMPSEPLAEDAQVIHGLASPPRPPKDVLWSHDDAAAARELQCRFLIDVVKRHVEAFPDDLYGRVAGVRTAASCGEVDDVSEALGRLADIAPDLTPVYADAVRALKYRQRWQAAEAGAFIDSLLASAGPEVQATLYGVTMMNDLLRKEPDPTIDTIRTADEYGRWIDLYPGSSFAEARLVSLLCRIGETGRAAARLNIRLCSEVRMSGSTWSTEICRECFGGDVIPRPGEAVSNQTTH